MAQSLIVVTTQLLRNGQRFTFGKISCLFTSGCWRSVLISPGQRGRMEAKRTRATSINPIYVRLPPWLSRLDTDAMTRRIVQGLFRTQKIVRLLSDIPCDIIHTLENDATEAKAFVDDIEQGKVPKIIANLPKEVTGAILGAISDLLHIFVTLPTEIVDVAEATITGAVNVFKDIESGAIVDDLKRPPSTHLSSYRRLLSAYNLYVRFG